MVRLRLRRKGRAHHPVYDIIAVDGRKRRDSDYLERLGYYDPNTVPSTISVNQDRAIYWLNVGAQPTEIVTRLLSYEGVLLRRFLQSKGKTDEEIAGEIVKHRETVQARFVRRKELRKKREAAKAKLAEETAKPE